MKKSIFLFLAFLGGIASLNAQIYKGVKNKISFYSYTPMENISAVDTVATMILNGKTGDVIANIGVKGFVFPNALMQEHFNENYMETDMEGPKDAAGKPTYPNRNAKFTGKINEPVDYTKDGTYTITITGNLLIHGVSQPRTIPATLVVKGDNVTIDSKFSVALVDHKIKVPEAVGTKIAEKIDVTVHCEMVNTAKK
ncbi:MAG TPA: YceI family protein [Bacteroidia bacterium]|nr:YceI family protein [Bacteroidia bacterium]